MKLKKVVIAPDSFKGTLSSVRVCRLIEEYFNENFSDVRCVSIPIADGGEGTVDAFKYSLGGKEKTISVSNPIGEPVKATYLLTGNHTAVMEMAQASGITLISPLSPMRADTFGTGEMIKDALDNGCEHIIIGIGGSATTDGGAGCLKALGIRFLDKNGNEVSSGGQGLKDIEKTDLTGLDKRINNCRITVLCDVKNPLYGENGAAFVFAKQKGADEKQIIELDKGLRNLASKAETVLGKDYSNEEGSGAAGGLGFALKAFLNAEMKSGIDTILDICGFDRKIADADLIITGEGKMDSQSLKGKVPFGVAKRAKGVPVTAIVGLKNIDENLAKENGINRITETNKEHLPFEEVKEKAEEQFKEALKDIEI